MEQSRVRPAPAEVRTRLRSVSNQKSTSPCETFNNDDALLSYSEIEIKFRCSWLFLPRWGARDSNSRTCGSSCPFWDSHLSGARYAIDLAQTPQPGTPQEMRPFLCFASSSDAAPGSHIAIHPSCCNPAWKGKLNFEKEEDENSTSLAR